MSILNDTKKMLGMASEYDAFDLDVMAHINSAFATLNQLGVGVVGYAVDNANDSWDEFTANKLLQSMIKTYVYYKVRLGFDPPTTGYGTTSLKELIKEQEWRISTFREEADWVPPPPLVPEDEDVLDGF